MSSIGGSKLDSKTRETSRADCARRLPQPVLGYGHSIHREVENHSVGRVCGHRLYSPGQSWERHCQSWAGDLGRENISPGSGV